MTAKPMTQHVVMTVPDDHFVDDTFRMTLREAVIELVRHQSQIVIHAVVIPKGHHAVSSASPSSHEVCIIFAP
jgi:hypothetical protein